MKTFTLENYKLLLGVPGVYMIQIHDKQYIGSSTSIGHRLKHHAWALSTQHHHNRTMQNLYNKYGLSACFFEKIEDCDPEILITREKYYIDTLIPYMNHILDPQKIVRDDIYKDRISKGLKKAYEEGLRPHNDKEIYMYNSLGFYVKSFSTCTNAAIAFGKMDPSAICMCARGKSYTVYNYRWSYIKMEKLPDFKKKYGYKATVQLTLKGEFIKNWNSCKEAETTLKISNISRAILENKTAGGYRWKHES